MIGDLFKSPERYSFFQAVRRLERLARARKRAGEDVPDGLVGAVFDPRTEAVRLRASTSLRFPASELVAAGPGQDGEPPELTVAFMSLAGAMGPLPAPYSAFLQDGGRSRRSAFADFLDMFHSRLIGLFYAAWAKYRLPVSYERHGCAGDDDISQLLRALVGLGLPAIQHRMAIPDTVALHYGGAFARIARSAGGLERLLAWEFSLPIRIDQFVGRWIAITPEEQTRLTGDPLAASPFSRLSGGAVVGNRILDVEGTFRVVIGPVDYAQFRQLLPTGRDLKRLRDFIRLYAPTHLNFTVRLILRADAVPEPRLHRDERGIQLSWTSWLRGDTVLADIGDVEFIG